MTEESIKKAMKNILFVVMVIFAVIAIPAFAYYAVQHFQTHEWGEMFSNIFFTGYTSWLLFDAIRDRRNGRE